MSQSLYAYTRTQSVNELPMVNIFGQFFFVIAIFMSSPILVVPDRIDDFSYFSLPPYHPLT